MIYHNTIIFLEIIFIIHFQTHTHIHRKYCSFSQTETILQIVVILKKRNTFIQIYHNTIIIISIPLFLFLSLPHSPPPSFSPPFLSLLYHSFLISLIIYLFDLTSSSLFLSFSLHPSFSIY